MYYLYLLIFLHLIIFVLRIYLFVFRPKPYLFKGDHKFPSANPDAPVVILYAELGTKEFTRFHQLMLAKANKGLITYVLRHFLSVRIKPFSILIIMFIVLNLFVFSS